MSINSIDPNLKRQNAIDSFKSLWKKDDPEWLKQRQEEWELLERTVFKGDSAKDKKGNKNYFLHGNKNDYIPVVTLLSMTPYDSEESLKTVFWSELFDSDARGQLYSNYIFDAPNYTVGMIWQRKSIQLFINAVLGKEYKEITETFGEHAAVVSPNVSYWARNYCVKARHVLVENSAYNGCIDSLSYFISALSQSTDPKYRKRIDLDKLFILSEQALAGDSVSQGAQEMAQNLITRKQDILDAWALNVHLD